MDVLQSAAAAASRTAWKWEAAGANASSSPVGRTAATRTAATRAALTGSARTTLLAATARSTATEAWLLRRDEHERPFVVVIASEIKADRFVLALAPDAD